MGELVVDSELIRLHIDAVYSSALRQVRDPHLPEDVTQAVFMLLARKAPSLGSHPSIAGWLFQPTRYACRAAVREQSRRRERERKAATMRSEVAVATDQPKWQE